MSLRRLTPGGRVTTIGACPTRLIAAATQKEVGFQDTLQDFADGSFRPIDGLETPKGSLPALSQDCRLLYTAVDRSTSELTDELVLWESGKTLSSTLYGARSLGVSDWGPDGRAAVVEQTPAEAGVESVSTAIVFIESDGRTKSVPAPASTLGSPTGDRPSGWR